MSTPVPPLVPTSAMPLATDSDAAFDAKAFPALASLNPFGVSLEAIGAATVANANAALAAALGGDLPAITGQALKLLRVNAGETAAEFVDPATVVLAEAPELTQVQVENPASTVFGQVSGQRLGQAVAANLPAPTPPTTSEVLSATAGAAFGAVGTYAFLYSGNNVSIVNGIDYAGSDLFAAGIWKDGSTISTDGTTSDISATRGGTAQSGTWKAMGRVNVASTAGNDTRITLFLRIA